MTVADLIDLLKAYNPTAIVLIEDADEGSFLELTEHGQKDEYVFVGGHYENTVIN